MSLTDDYLKARNRKTLVSPASASDNTDTFTRDYLEARKRTAEKPAPVSLPAIKNTASVDNADNNKKQATRYGLSALRQIRTGNSNTSK